jgi:UDP-N-acetylglucosamine 2-epimerase (non-hydrolysing)
MQPIWVVAGTRPEIVKLAPVLHALRRNTIRPVHWISTGQHTDLAEQTLRSFAIEPNVRLSLARSAPLPGDIFKGTDSVSGVLGRLIQNIDGLIARDSPALVVVQGDTTSTVAASLAAFGHRIPIAHVEAGLRTFDLSKPFPEEAWRTIVGQIADLHLAPTERAANNIIATGVAADRVLVTGNTVIDALRWLAANRPDETAPAVPTHRTVLVTLHRRENWGAPFESVCATLIKLANRIPDIKISFIAHANPQLRARAEQALGGHDRIEILAPLDYVSFIHRMRKSTLILSDSGGIQEEAPAFGIPALILRDSTERPEAVEAGVAQLVGIKTAAIFDAASKLLLDAEAYGRMARVTNPFGDGTAGEKIAAAIEAFMAKGTPSRSAAA